MSDVSAKDRFEGKFYAGMGDVEYLELLDFARRMFDPDPEIQNLPMLYDPRWNGLAEGPQWGGWWIQNSLGPTYCALPFYSEPYTTFLQNSQSLWFEGKGDGTKRTFLYRLWKIEKDKFEWEIPDGCLCDCATPDRYIPKQGDGRVEIHDWGMEFTAAGLLVQAELLLIGREPDAIAHYLPKLERCADFVETRRDSRNNLFLAGPAGNLLAPSFAGLKKPDGTYDKAYLSGLSITYIAALDRLIELEQLTGNDEKAHLYAERRDLAKQGLPRLMTEEGYFIKSLDPDGTRHGVYGAGKHGYFEAVCNHDAIAFRVADDAQAQRIYAKIASIPGLRPLVVIITNYPSLDDMYTEPTSNLAFGMWVNGGAWSTCEARMILAYYRLGQYEDARRSMKQLLSFARRFELDAPFSDFGGTVSWYQHPIYLTYDPFGVPAALIRGLFEYLYRADGLTLIPHIPPGIVELEQRFPIRFGKKRIYLSSAGTGDITGVWINGSPWKHLNVQSVFLPYDRIPETACVQIALGGATPANTGSMPSRGSTMLTRGDTLETADDPKDQAGKMRDFYARLIQADPGGSYEAAHAGLALEYVGVVEERRRLQAEGKIQRLPDASQAAADRSYTDTATKLCEGLRNVVEAYAGSSDPHKAKVYHLWQGAFAD